MYHIVLLIVSLNIHPSGKVTRLFNVVPRTYVVIVTLLPRKTELPAKVASQLKTLLGVKAEGLMLPGVERSASVAVQEPLPLFVDLGPA